MIKLESSLSLFLDTVDFDEIEALHWLSKGITTTPTFFRRQGVCFDSFVEHVRRSFPQHELHVEALGRNKAETDRAIEEISTRKWYDPSAVILKIPVSAENLELVTLWTSRGVRFNLHLVFTPLQAFLSAQAGATYVCPLLGRFCDYEGTRVQKDSEREKDLPAHSLLTSIQNILSRTNSETKLMASSIRTTELFHGAILQNPDVVTVPPKVLRAALHHDLTEAGVRTFLNDMSSKAEVAGTPNLQEPHLIRVAS